MISNQSLQRGLTILDLLDRAPAPLGIRELARLMELSPTIVQRLTNTLVVAGYVEQVAETRRYKLGYRAMQLGGAMITEDRLISLAAKELQQLADNHQLNGYLGALRNNRVVYLHSVQSSGPVVVRISVGAQVNAHSTALGKILLAELPVSAVKSIVGKPPYEQFTSRTITQWSALASELEIVRDRGFAISREENINGIVSFGALVRNADGDAVAALSVAGLAIEEARWPATLQLVLDAAHRCSVSLGYRGAAIKVSVGVAFLAATLVLGDSMRSGFNRAFTEANAGTDVVVRSSTVIGSSETRVRDTIPAGVLDTVAAVDGVATAAPSIEGTATIIGADGDRIGGDGPPTTGANWIDEPTLNPYRLAEGRAPSADDEVVIDRGSAERGDLAVGDRTTVLTPEPVEVAVVGIATFGDVDSLGPTTYTAFTLDAARDLLLGRPDALSSVLVAAEDGVNRTTLREEIAQLLPARIEALTQQELTAEQEADIESDFLGMFEVILLAFAGIALVVAAFSIHNTFSILVAQRTRESALLRAMGASRRQVLAAVAVEAFVVGVVASAIGLGVGLGLAAGLDAIAVRIGARPPRRPRRRHRRDGHRRGRGNRHDAARQPRPGSQRLTRRSAGGPPRRRRRPLGSEPDPGRSPASSSPSPAS